MKITWPLTFIAILLGTVVNAQQPSEQEKKEGFESLYERREWHTNRDADLTKL